jgi:hypothetical protein
MQFTNKIFIWWCFIFYFDITLIVFLSHIFHFLCDRHGVIWKVHYESKIFKHSSNFLMMIPIKIYDNMNNSKIDNVNFEYGLKFYVVCSPEKLQVC